MDNAIPLIGPVILIANVATMFLCFRPKRGIIFTLAVLAVYGTAVHFFFVPAIMDTFIASFGGVIIIPMMMLLFKGQVFQKVFANFMVYQLTSMQGFIIGALVEAASGDQSSNAIILYFVVSLLILIIYMAMVLRFGRRLFERMFVEGRRADWAVYAFGAVFSFMISAVLRWQAVGVPLYIALMLYILWSFGVLCFTIINAHERAARAHKAQTLLLQMNAMREQTDAENKHRDDMEILRHDMRHEMGVIMELFRTGKGAEAEAVYAGWRSSLSGAVPAALCAEPVLNAVFGRFERRAADKDIRLYVNSNVPSSLPIDTIKLSVIVSNALENALAATDGVRDKDRRAIRVKLLQSGAQIGLEVVNPCAGPVEFDGKGLPVTREEGHGIGVRSIAAFAKDNGYLLDFRSADEKFTMRLVMGL